MFGLRPRLQATVDRLGPSLIRAGFTWFDVTVTEASPSTERRVYRIEATSDNVAAQEGLRRLERELVTNRVLH